MIIDADVDAELRGRFTTHDLTPDQISNCQGVREQGRLFASALATYCPQSHELLLAIDAVDQAVMWANASIAREGK